MSNTDDVILTAPEPVGTELPRSKRQGSSDKFEPFLEQIKESPDLWFQLTQPTDKANNLAANLRNGIGAPSARYDRMTVSHNGETREVPVPADFEVKAVGTGEKVDYQKRDGTWDERSIGVVYARYLTDSTREEVREEIEGNVRQRIDKSQENGDS